MDGRSILGLLRGEGGWREVIDLEHDVCYDDSNHWNAVTDGRYKYIFHAQTGEEQLFDLINDPREEHDLAQESGKRSLLGDWRGVMIECLRERGAPFVVKGDIGFVLSDCCILLTILEHIPRMTQFYPYRHERITWQATSSS